MPVGGFGTASSYTIREMKADGSAVLPNGYVIELRGRALPHRPYEVSGDMRAEFTEYPGNPISTAQLLGAKENETTINGWWKDRFIRPSASTANPEGVALLNGLAAADVMALSQAVDAVRRRGQLLEVTWDEVTRHGILTKFVQRWHRRQDLEYEVTFRWISQGEQQPPLAFNVQPSRADLEQILATKLAALQAVLSPAFQVAEDFQTGLNSAVSNISGAIEDIGNASLNLVNIALTPAGAVRRTLAALQTVKDDANVIKELVESRAPQAYVSAAQPFKLAFGAVLAATEYGRSLKRTSRDLATTAADQGDQLRNSVDTQTLLAAFTARQDMDLRDVSTRFYGTQEQWKTIAQYNSILGSKLNAGELVFVPRLTTQGT